LSKSETKFNNISFEDFPLPNVKVGDKIVVRYNQGNPNNRLYHVRGFVDNQIVVAYWSKRGARKRLLSENRS
jgi:hypothetical protein